jgi:hypothetical protein
MLSGLARAASPLLQKTSSASASVTRAFTSTGVAQNWLKDVPMGPADPILGLTDRYNKVQEVPALTVRLTRLTVGWFNYW